MSAALQAAHPGLTSGFALNSAVFGLGLPVLLAGLTPVGVAHAWFLGGSIFAAFGWPGYLLVCLYFVLGSAVTKLKLKEKEAAGIAEKRSGRRGPVRPPLLQPPALQLSLTAVTCRAASGAQG